MRLMLKRSPQIGQGILSGGDDSGRIVFLKRLPRNDARSCEIHGS